MMIARLNLGRSGHIEEQKGSSFREIASIFKAMEEIRFLEILNNTSLQILNLARFAQIRRPIERNSPVHHCFGDMVVLLHSPQTGTCLKTRFSKLMSLWMKRTGDERSNRLRTHLRISETIVANGKTLNFSGRR